MSRLSLHVIDSDTKRRAHIAHTVHSDRVYAEVYASIDEFTARPPSSGAVLANDDGSDEYSMQIFDALKRGSEYLPVAFFSDDPSPAKIVQAMLLGALDYLKWPFVPDELDRAVKRLTVVENPHSSAQGRRLEACRSVDALSPREREVLGAIVQGHSNKMIGSLLDISPRTVEVHRSNLFLKIGAKSTADAVRIGCYAGLDG